ncbi:hypothetical protein MHU86_7832 [Fragilaria crotonensis]|nr:hypothetical protein MHU86_7832 [Fragilaria crotonensis]
MIQYVVDDEMNVPVTVPTDPKTNCAYQDDSDLEDDFVQRNADKGTGMAGRDIMSRFFNDWDEDNSDSLDIEELLAGIEKCCDALNIDYDSRRISALFDKLDTDGNHSLDRKEFTVFLQRFADDSNIGMEDLAFVMADNLSQREYDPLAGSRKSRNARTDFFKGLFSVAAFPIGRNEEVANTKDPIAAAVLPFGLTSFLKQLGPRLYERRGSTEVDETIVELSVDDPNFDDSKEDIQNMMWDIATD